MTKEDLKNEVIQQLNIGFLPAEIWKDLVKKGYDSNEVKAMVLELTKEQKSVTVNSKSFLYAIFLVVTGLVLFLTLKEVSGSLDFRFTTSGDAIRWKELFFQPWGAILVAILGIIVLITKKNAASVFVRIPGITWFAILLILAAFANDAITMILSMITIWLIIMVTRKAV